MIKSYNINDLLLDLKGEQMSTQALVSSNGELLLVVKGRLCKVHAVGASRNGGVSIKPHGEVGFDIHVGEPGKEYRRIFPEHTDAPEAPEFVLFDLSQESLRSQIVGVAEAHPFDESDKMIGKVYLFQ